MMESGQPRNVPAKWVVLALYVLVIILVGAHFVNASREAARRTRERERAALEARYSMRCVSGTHLGSEYCDSWARRLVEEYEEAAEACISAFDDKVFECLDDHYAPAPLE